MTKKIKNDWDDEWIDNSPIDDLFDKYDDEYEKTDIDSDDTDIESDDDKSLLYLNDLEDVEETEIKPQKKKRVQLKPKLMGKHSLAYDTIFKGKKNEISTEPFIQSEHIIKNAGGSLDINDNDIDLEESRNNIDAYRDIRLKNEIQKILETNTDINFTANRRKPAQTDFNAYFTILIKELAKYGYSRTEIFIELSGYFSDNIWNIFLLLDKKYSNIIIKELKDKYGLSDMDKIDFIG